MTKEEIVKSFYPKAVAEKFKEGKIKGMQTTYYLVFSQAYQGIRLGSGETKAKAWSKALENIKRFENTVND